jgi:hypothetical protein
MGEDMCHTYSVRECIRKEHNTIRVRSEKGCWGGRLGSARRLTERPKRSEAIRERPFRLGMEKDV